MGLTNDQPHAVTGAYGNSYGYDANGNQVRRTIAGVEYTLVYDYENRLVTVQQGEATMTKLLYDAAGRGVNGTVAGVSTVYIAGLYEQSGAASASYYEGGAMRRAGYAESNGVFYLLHRPTQVHQRHRRPGRRQGGTPVLLPLRQQPQRRGFQPTHDQAFHQQSHEQGLPGARG